tara:strand:- start:768 stop:1688 length:921 start_codon:yes stop_codon:yes gene_type:complete
MMPFKVFLPEGVDLEHLLDRLRYFSWGAADILISYSKGEQPPYGFPKALDIQEGGDGPVSAADLSVNQWLLNGLESSFPAVGWQLISEESVKEFQLEEISNKKDWLWILDPLDGTKDFLQGTGEYAVHLALVHENTPVLGVVLIPEKEELWFGVIGKGAWCEDRKGNRYPVQFSNRSALNDLILVSSRNHRDQRLEKLINYLALGGNKSVGSVGCKVATVLRGDADIYISLSGKSAPKDWDMAAPEAVLKAAGGQFTHADGINLEYNKKNSFEQRGCLIASHGISHELICIKSKNGMSNIDPDFRV